MMPFQRVPGTDKLISAETVSVPQMVSSDGKTLKPAIYDAVAPRVGERLVHNTMRFLTKG